MKIIELDGRYLLLVKYEENDQAIWADTKDIIMLGVEQEKKTNVSGQTEIVPKIVMSAMFPNMFGMVKTTYPKNKIIIHELHPESTIIKEVNRQRSVIEVVSAPSTGDKNLDKKILLGDFKKKG